MVKLADITTKPQQIKIPVFHNQNKFNKWYVEVYLKSPHWIAFALLLKQKYPFCAECYRSSVALETHHETYNNLGKETEEDCRNLCADCHKTIHQLLQELGFATERDYVIWLKTRKTGRTTRKRKRK